MTLPAAIVRTFEPGTTGWTADDLNDPAVAQLWDDGPYEIVEGVLTTMPPAYYDGSLPLSRLRRTIERHLDRHDLPGEFATEVDLVLSPMRVLRPDLMFMTPDDHARQQTANAAGGRPDLKFGRILVAPTLVVESVSPGHEAHDRHTKRLWFAQASFPNYWILDAYSKSLDCLTLDRGSYRIDTAGRDADTLRPSLFPGLEIALSTLWA